MTAPSPEAVRARLEEIRAARGGFVLPHHGLMAAALPDLHAAYEVMYRALTLEARHLAPMAREAVWLAVLSACEEPVGTHHLQKFRETGGTEAQTQALLRLACWAAGASRYAVLDAAWGGHLGTPMRDAYLEGGRALLGGAIAEPLARTCLAAVHAASDQRWGLEAEIEAALTLGVPEHELAEALSLVIWPRGVNRFVRAAEAWLALIRAGRIPASEPFRAWAAAPDQGPLRI
jgi:hypothetical protein